MLVRQIGTLATTWCAHDEAFLDEEWLADFLDGARVLAHCRGYGIHTYWAAFKLINNGRENLVIHVIKAMLVHIESFQTNFCNV